MGNERIFTVKDHYLVEIDETQGLGVTRTYSWEIFIAAKGFEYKGKAVEPKDQKRSIPWMTIEEPDECLETMINAIKSHMKRF